MTNEIKTTIRLTSVWDEEISKALTLFCETIADKKTCLELDVLCQGNRTEWKSRSD